MARITWQNVAAPDLQESSRSQALAARLIGDATKSIGQGISGLDYRARNKASAAAMNQAMGIRDVDDWDKTMENGGLMALGVSPDRATPELMQFMQGYRKQLAGNRSSDLTNKTNEYDYARGIEEDNQDDWRFGREQTNAAKADAAAALDLEAQNLAGLVTDSTLSADEGRQRILSQTEGSPQLRERALQYFKSGSSDGYSSLGNIDYQDETKSNFTVLEEGLAQQESEMQLRYAGNEALEILDEGTDKYGADPLKGLLESATNAVQKEGLENEDEAINESRGSVRAAFNRLKRDFPDIPDEIIASVVERSWTDDGWLLTGDKEKLDLRAAGDVLRQLDTPENRQVLYDQGNVIRRNRKSIESVRKDALEIQERLNVAISRGDEAGANKERAKLSKLIEGYKQSRPAPSQAGSASTATGPGVTQAPTDLDTQLDSLVQDLPGMPGAGVGPQRTNANQAQAESASQAFRDIAGEVATWPGQGLGDLAGLGTGAVAGLNRAAAPWVSGISPAAGATMLNWADGQEQDARTLMGSDLFQMAADGIRNNVQDIRTQNSASPERQIQTPQNITEGLQAMVQAGDIDPATAIRAEALMTMIQTKKDPFTGQDLSPQRVETMRRMLEQLLSGGKQ